MSSDPQILEEESTDEYGSELNAIPIDELAAAVSASARGAGDLLIIQTLQRLIRPVLIPVLVPILVPILTPLIIQIVEERIGLAMQEPLSSIEENPRNDATTSNPKRLKLQFRNRISLPVFTGRRLLGENETSIEIALVDAFTNQIMNTGIESTAKLEIVGFPVGDNDRLTFEDFQEKVMSEKKGKRMLQGDTCLQLKEGVCFLSKISFTHNSENKKNGLYRLGAGVVDAALMNRVEVATTEAFLMKDGRTKYYEKHPHPLLSDKVCHLQQISYKGKRHRHLKDEGVVTVKNLLTLLYTDSKRLQNILKVGASSNIWRDIVKNAQASNGMFLFLDSSKEEKTGVVLDAKQQLKGLIAETLMYVPVEQLSAKQKVDNKELVTFASQHFETLRPFEDETSLKKYLMSLPSTNQSLGTSNMIDEPASPSSLMSAETPHSLYKSNSHIAQHTTQAPIVTSLYDRGKAIVSFDNEMTYPMNYHEEDMPPHLVNFESPSRYYPTEPGTSFQAVDSPVHTCGHMSNSNSECTMDFVNNLFSFEEFDPLLGPDSIHHFDLPNNEWHSQPVNSVSVCTDDHARTRWTVTKVSILLMNIYFFKIRALKRQRCFKRQRRC